jgi:4-amino-4-deoxy-L-arabinose transferase-like glycosyltransferase
VDIATTRIAWTSLIVVALVKVLLHFATNLPFLGYGYFIDEFYYLACASRLDWGYVDHPPLAPLLLAGNRLLFGDSMFSVRVLPALAGGTVVLLTGLMSRELGGGTFAQAFAALAVTIAPVHLVLDSFYSMNAFEALIWTLAAFLFIRLVRTRRPTLWLSIGVVFGIGLEFKHTSGMFALCLGIGLLFSPARRQLRTVWPWLGALVAFAIVLPNILWEARHDWISVEFYRSANLRKNIDSPALAVLWNQILSMQPVTFPIWLAGLWFYFFRRAGAPFRALGIAYVLLLALAILAHSSRPDRLAGAYPMLLAAGAVVFETATSTTKRPWVRPLAVVLLIAGGVSTLPASVPILPPEWTAKYCEALGLSVPIERGKISPLPQYFADRFGWTERVAAVADAYAALSPEERQKAAILCGYYGPAGAIELFGQPYGLPQPISPHNSYYEWGYNGATCEIAIAIGLPESVLKDSFEDVQAGPKVQCDFCLQKGDVFVVRRLKVPADEFWRNLRHFE